MEHITYQVKIRVYIPEMLNFFKEDPRLGTKENPYKADMFYEVLSPYAHFYGPLRNILVFEKNAKYVWSVESADGEELHFTSINDTPEMELEMITDKPSDEKWNKVFKKPPKMQPDGKLKLKSSVRSSNVFSLETTENIEDGGKIKYSFLFEFEDIKGDTKYGIVDPVSDFYPPPPP
ncbi:MAG: hypothetical protein K9G70_01910 [Prolixibacteraceae bacterium]|nr:hypothetical protein [Prolixibacteraceae bacterium]